MAVHVLAEMDFETVFLFTCREYIHLILQNRSEDIKPKLVYNLSHPGAPRLVNT